jgi:hypothetical protein
MHDKRGETKQWLVAVKASARGIGNGRELQEPVSRVVLEQ